MPILSKTLEIPNLALYISLKDLNAGLKADFAACHAIIDVCKPMAHSPKMVKNAKVAFTDGAVELSLTLSTKNMTNFTINEERAKGLINSIILSKTASTEPILDEPALSVANEPSDDASDCCSVHSDNAEFDTVSIALDESIDTPTVAAGSDEALELDEPDALSDDDVPVVDARSDNVQERAVSVSDYASDEDAADEDDYPDDEFEPAREGPVVQIGKSMPVGKYLMGGVSTVLYAVVMHKIFHF